MSDNHFTDKTERFTFIPDDDGSGYILRSVHTEDTEIDVPASYNGKPVTAIGEKAFYDRKDITRVTLPDSIKKIGSSAFYGCGIEKLELPPDLEYIGDRAFMKCNELIEVEINSVIKSIGSSAFEACHGLHYVGMSGCVISIGDRAFCSCWSLISFDLPLALKEIGRDVFKDCDRVSISYRGSLDSWKEVKKPFKLFNRFVVHCWGLDGNGWL